MKQGIFAALQFVLGFILGIVILAGGAAAVGYFIFSRMASPPNKPIFAEELKEKTVATQDKAKPTASASSPSQSKDQIPTSDLKKDDKSAGTTAQPNTQPSSSPDGKSTQPEAAKDVTPDKTAEKETTLPKGAYKGKVTWSSGLSLRADPNTSASRVGGVDYNSELIILETSQDGQWQKVRVANGTQEGWVKAGNIKKSAE